MVLSIITINYNNYQGLSRTIKSVLSQSWQEFEWIIIDGGSTDGSKELIENLLKEGNNKISFFCSEKDSGVYNAMNKGILHASGKYINFMNSGDTYATESSLYEVFSSLHEEDILYGYMFRKHIDGQLNNESMMKPVLEWYDFYDDTLPHQSSFIKKELFDKYGLYDETYKALADWKFFIMAINCKKATYKFLPIKVSVYECGGISDNENGLVERNRLREEMFPPRVKNDITRIKSINSVRSIYILRGIYSVLYRLSILFEKK